MTTQNRNDSNWIQTFTGIKFYPLDPRVEEFSLEDIAHALSQLCRFTGHGRFFYSVGYHSLLVSSLLLDKGYNHKIVLYGLLHDASEAYLNDIARPLKHNLPDYLKVEDVVQSKVWEAFGLPEPTDEEWAIVKWADDVMLTNEIEQMMKVDNWNIPTTDDFVVVPIKKLDMEYVEKAFIEAVTVSLVSLFGQDILETVEEGEVSA